VLSVVYSLSVRALERVRRRFPHLLSPSLITELFSHLPSP
jgi:hypothetical protein